MDVRVEAGVMQAGATTSEVKVTTVKVVTEFIAPVFTSFSLTPVISVGGNSISSITPELYLIGVKAAA